MEEHAEIIELTSLLQILDSIFFFPDEEDKLIWMGDKTGTSSAYLNDYPSSSAAVYPRKKIWSEQWPFKVAFFLRQLVQNRLPTIDNLQKRNCAPSLCPSLCPLCKRNW
ncbi:hypothetical protein MKW94_008271 [Papaver nudicaule]|uniref:Reverse transcriptase zinc-binding domain-containing protein n=1 Tax=Papaver nudicaule TaxID=74823 RepID=A0AA41RZ68_PAPNU|nr:hypothetical protein [Papaver nudicaule]